MLCLNDPFNESLLDAWGNGRLDGALGLRSGAGWMRSVWACKKHEDPTCQLSKCRLEYERWLGDKKRSDGAEGSRGDDDGPSAQAVAYQRRESFQRRLVACTAAQRTVLYFAFKQVEPDKVRRTHKGEPRPRLLSYILASRAVSDAEGSVKVSDCRGAVLVSDVSHREFKRAMGIDLRSPESYSVAGHANAALLSWLEEIAGNGKKRDLVERIVKGTEKELLAALIAFGVEVSGVKVPNDVSLAEVARCTGRSDHTIKKLADEAEIPLRPGPRGALLMNRRDIRQRRPDWMGPLASSAA